MSENEEQQQDEQEAESEIIAYSSAAAPGTGSHRTTELVEERGPQLWLITFTDIMALMLTFFVMMYTMSVPEEEKWNEMSTGVSSSMSKFKSARSFAGVQDSISIDKLDMSRGLSLDYLEALVQEIIGKNENLKNAVLIPQRDRLVLSLPVDLLFEAGQADVRAEGKRALFALGGPLSRIKNRIEVIGHADPRPVETAGSAFGSNWELSLARAINVAAQLENVGYTRSVIIRGAAGARYDELPDDLSEEERLSLARRVDIVIMKDTGAQRFIKAPVENSGS